MKTTTLYKEMNERTNKRTNKVSPGCSWHWCSQTHSRLQLGGAPHECTQLLMHTHTHTHTHTHMHTHEN